jgi:hypothetical protein
MLPISPRASESYKHTYFPFHYDRYFWKNKRYERLKRSKFIRPLLALEKSRDAIAAWRDRLRVLWKGPKTQRSFSILEMEDPRNMPFLYGILATSEDVIQVTENGYLHKVTRGNLLKKACLLVSIYLISPVMLAPFLQLPANDVDIMVEGSLVPPPIFVTLMLTYLACWAVDLSRTAHRRPISPTARAVERGPSVPAGWKAKADEIAAVAPWPLSSSSLSSGAGPAGLRGVHLVWGMACEIQNAVNRASWNRMFFVTENGYIGIGPVGMAPGDDVFLLLGGHVPYVLRSKETSACYHVIGESYVHGVMDGELWEDGLSLKQMKDKSQRVVLV